MWINLIENRKVVEAIYGDDVLNLKEIRIIELAFHQDGPSCTLSLEIKQLPTNPPLKWRTLKYNAVNLTIQLVEIEAVELIKWSIDNIVDLIIENINSQKVLILQGDNCKLKLTFKWLYIKSISPYIT